MGALTSSSFDEGRVADAECLLPNDTTLRSKMFPDGAFPMLAGSVDVGKDLQCEDCLLTFGLQRFPSEVLSSVRYHRRFPAEPRGSTIWSCKPCRAQVCERKEWVDKLPGVANPDGQKRG